MEGTSLGPYRVLEKLGTGGMGVVYLALDTRLGRHVALKLIKNDATAPIERQRLIHEARAAALLNHPQIASVYDVLEADDHLCIVLEYAGGRSLSDLVKKEGPVPIDLAISVGAQLAEALAYAHERGVIHRDIKPANVHVTESGAAKLLDLGIAAIVPSGPPADSIPTDSTNTTVRGTPAYMAPEQIAGARADARGDIYSLGALLFELVTGRPPFPGRTFADQALAAAGSPAPRGASINPAVPPELDEAIQQALSLDPGARQPNALALAAQLRAIQAARSSERTVEGTAVPRSRRRRLAVIYAPGIALVVLIAILIVTGLKRSDGSAAGSRRTVVAVLPVKNVTGDGTTEGLGTAIASLLTANVGSVPGVTMLSRAETAPYRTARDDVQRIVREVGADYVVDLSSQSRPSSQLVITAALKQRDGRMLWSDTFEGDVFNVERQVLDGVARALQQAGALRRNLDENEWSRIRKLPTTDALALNEYSQGLLLLDKREPLADLEQAAELFSSATRRDPTFALAFAGLAETNALRYQRTRDSQLAEQALEAADMALRLDPEQSAVRVAMAAVRYLTGRRLDAIKELRLALAAQPDNDEAFRLLGRALSSEGDTAGAVGALQQALTIRPEHWNHHFTLAYILYTAGRLDEAAAEYQRTIELLPTYAAAYQMLGTIAHRRGDLSKAIGYYEHAVNLGPTAAAVANLGYFYFKAGRYDEAVRAYERAVQLEGQEPVRRRNLADAYRRAGRQADAVKQYEAAIEMGQRILKVNPHDANVISLIALCEARLLRKESAERHAAQAMTVRQPTREVLSRVAQAYALMGNSKEALTALAAAIKHGYEDAATDDEFDAIRNTDAFKAIVSREGSR